MKLHIPQQSQPAKDALPNHPRKVKKWLANLPHANMGELTRRIYTGIRDLNQQTMPAKYRMENMELMREPMRGIFNNLKKYFINRTLPLPDKSRKIVNLNQSLMLEMINGYKIIVSSAANGVEKKIDKKLQTIAICRAMRYTSEMLLRASQIYAQVHRGVWHDLHQLYLYAESNEMVHIVVNDIEHINKKTTIEKTYKQILLFSLARPTAMRQSDTERVYNNLINWSDQTKLDNNPQEVQINRFFRVRLNEDRPPNYLTQEDCTNSSQVRTLDTSELVDTIRKQISANEDIDVKNKKIAVGEELPEETLKVLAMSWGVCAKRRFSRAASEGKVKAAIGLTNIAKAIIDEEKGVSVEEAKVQEQQAKISSPEFSLEEIPDPMSREGYMTHHEIGKESNDAWDMVAKGRVMTNTYEKERQMLNKDKLKLKKEEPDLHWEIANISAGGYCLRWNSETTSRAQIGELIALLEAEVGGKSEWRIGVIRWMQFTAQSGLEIGVQVLSPKVIAAQVQRPSRPNEQPLDCLMLPGIRPLKQPPTVLMPAHAFKTGEKLKALIFDHNMDIVLGEVGEHTGSFTQFKFANSEEIIRAQQEAKKKSAEKQNDFDEIWSSL